MLDDRMSASSSVSGRFDDIAPVMNVVEVTYEEVLLLVKNFQTECRKSRRPTGDRIR